MNSQDLRDQLHPYLDGELDPERTLEVERALEEHPECRAELEEIKAVQLMARAAFMGPVADVDLSQVADNVMAQLEADGALRTAEASAPSPADGEGLVAWLKGLLTFEQPLMSLAAAAAIVALVVGAMSMSPPPSEEGAATTNVAATTPAPPSSPATEAVAEAPKAAPPIGKRRGPELESDRHAAFVEHIEAAKGRVVVDANTEDPSKPMVLWHHVDEGGALPIEGDSPSQEL